MSLTEVTGVSEVLTVLGAGLGAGILTSTVGFASVLSFPVLLAVGLPPVAANTANTVGLTPGAISGSWGYREELREHPRVTAVGVGVCALGAVAGAALLLVLPPGVFEAIVPWLILFTCLLVGAQPRISAWARSRVETRGEVPVDRTTMGPLTTIATAVTGVYGGYFGAGSGVMALAVLALGLDIDLRVLNALKTMAIMGGNVVASVIFIVAADLDWSAIGLLALGSVLGGYVGARIGRRLPAPVLRGLVVVGGAGASLALLLG